MHQACWIIARLPYPQQPRLVIRPPACAGRQPTEDDIAARDAPTGIPWPFDHRTDFLCRFCWNPLVCIDEQHPVRLTLDRIKGGVALIGIIVKYALKYPRPCQLCNHHRLIIAEGVEHQQIITEAQAVEAVHDVVCLVFGKDNSSQVHQIIASVCVSSTLSSAIARICS